MSGTRGKRTPAQQAYIDRAVSFGCLLTFLKTGVAGTPAVWHHRRSGTGIGRLAEHEDGIALAPHYHANGREALHTIGLRRWQLMHGYTELELIERSKAMHGWTGEQKPVKVYKPSAKTVRRAA